ncbi:lysylphosphatidylglycerol synthase domain-containing protein [Nocardioides sp.]|uniref:lysylphosphatidylglycerol synthase domain-containing protein n=1 Tax=Nocardioides sp. TaxID=35761 RepID=UPI003D148BBB
MVDRERARRVGAAVFLGAVAAFAWFGLRGRFDEIGRALADTSLVGALAALVLVLVGLLSTGVLWLRLMVCLDARMPLVDALGTFFVGQLGKYLPGSVWSIGAQAELARRHGVPARTTVTAGLLFLGYHVDTAVLLAAGTLLAGGLESPWPSWLSWIALGVSAGLLMPALLRRLAGQVAGQQVRLGWMDTVWVVALMGVAWLAYAGALVLLRPGARWDELVALGAAFAAAYAVGVLVVFAPAGVGAREAVFVLLLTPVIGAAPATALALLARVVHTVADALMATGWALWARRSGSRDPARVRAAAP